MLTIISYFIFWIFFIQQYWIQSKYKNAHNIGDTFIVSQTSFGANFQNDWKSRLNTIARTLNVTIVCYISVVYSCFFLSFFFFFWKHNVPDWSDICKYLVYRVTNQKSTTGITPSYEKVTESQNKARESVTSGPSQSELTSSDQGSVHQYTSTPAN